MRLGCQNGPLQSLCVHVAQHQDVARLDIHHDGWKQAVGVETRSQHITEFDLFNAHAIGKQVYGWPPVDVSASSPLGGADLASPSSPN